MAAFLSRYDHMTWTTTSEAASKVARAAHMRHLVAKIERQHRAGKLTARERIAALPR